MAGQASGGQKLTPNPNVNAPATAFGELWGANGGGITPIGGGATDQTGYVKPVAITPSDCETAVNYLPSTPQMPSSILGQESVGALSGQTRDSALASGGSNAG
jgi:hypothetical protein